MYQSSMKKPRKGEPLTHNVNRVSRTGEAAGVILDYIGSFVYSLNGAGFDIELVIAETISPAGSIMLA